MKQWIAQNYNGAPRHVRIHVSGRWRLFPFTKLGEFLPQNGTFIDIGCGYGHWPMYLGYIRPNARIYGYDPDATKINTGKAAIQRSGLGNVQLGTLDVDFFPWIKCNLVSIIDVLYLIPFNEQEKLLKDAFYNLDNKGRVIIKEMSRKPLWKFVWNWIEEWLAVRILKITMGKRFYFRSQNEWEILLKGIGFKLTTCRLDQGYIHPHILFVGDKPE